MSINYTIAIGVIEDINLLNQCFDEIGFIKNTSLTSENTVVDYQTFTIGNLIADIIEANELARNIFEETLEISITQKIIIHVPDDISYSDNDTCYIMQLINKLLEKVNFLAFLFNGEKLLLIKTKDKLAIDSSSKIWSDKNVKRALSNIDMKLDRQKLPTI